MLIKRNTHIDIYKSIQTGYVKPLYKRGFFEYVELILSVFYLILVSIYMYILADLELKVNRLPDQLLGVLLIIFLLLSLYGVYRKLTERKLFYITHNLTKTNFQKLIINHLNIDKSSIIEADDLLMGNKIHSYYHIAYIFIFKKDKIYFNITNQFQKLNPPVFFSHLFLKRDFKKLIKQSGFNKNN